MSHQYNGIPTSVALPPAPVPTPSPQNHRGSLARLAMGCHRVLSDDCRPTGAAPQDRRCAMSLRFRKVPLEAPFGFESPGTTVPPFADVTLEHPSRLVNFLTSAGGFLRRLGLGGLLFFWSQHSYPTT
jgi:hypothetical protein